MIYISFSVSVNLPSTFMLRLLLYLFPANPITPPNLLTSLLSDKVQPQWSSGPSVNPYAGITLLTNAEKDTWGWSLLQWVWSE